PLAQLLADLGRPPSWILALEPDDRGFNRHRELVGVSIRPPAAISQRVQATRLVAVENLVAGLPRDAERGAQRRHLFALEQAGDEPQPLVHGVTLLPRHAPSSEGAKVSPMCPEYGVTYLSGRTNSVNAVTCGRCGFEPSRQLRAISGQIAEQSVFDLLDGLTVRRVDDVRIDVERRRNARVPELLLSDLHRHPEVVQ